MRKYIFLGYFLLGYPLCVIAEEIPQTLPVVLYQDFNGTCPSAEERAAIRDDIQQQVMSLLNITLQNQPPCVCGGPGQWTRIAHLNMSDPSQQCPARWHLVTTPVRGCVSSNFNGPSCDSAMFPSNGLLYSRVCGRVNAYQNGATDAFDSSINYSRGLEDAYVDGVSLTHGAAGSCQHIWTFASAPWEMDPEFGNYTDLSCACTNVNYSWPHELPSFVGSSYFCETGRTGPGYLVQGTVFPDDPLWDGEGCGPTSTCCEFNNPPWFCTTLPQPTTDDIELRICRDQEASNEDLIVDFIDISVM